MSRAVCLFLRLAFVYSFGIPPVGKYNDIYTAPFHPAIHNMGNIGLLGKLHAASAWRATRFIDKMAYKGVNMREMLAQRIATNNRACRLLEVGCGSGTLTYELERTGAFDIVALDTSEEMLSVARKSLNPNTTLVCQNGVDFNGTADVAVVCMVMHELPKSAHEDMLQALMRVVQRGVIWVVDIDPTYSPSALMLSGEPYVLKYLDEFEATLHATCAERTVESVALIPDHVRAWVITCR